MRCFVSTLLFALVLPLTAEAGGRAPVTEVLSFKESSSTNTYNLLEGVALNDATPANRTVTLALGKRWPTIRVNIFYTYSAGTTVTMVPSCSFDGTNYAIIQTGSVSSGVRTLSNLTDTKTTGAASHNFQTSVGVKGCESVQLLFSGAGVGAGDLVNVQVTAISGT